MLFVQQALGLRISWPRPKNTPANLRFPNGFGSRLWGFGQSEVKDSRGLGITGLMQPHFVRFGWTGGHPTCTISGLYCVKFGRIGDSRVRAQTNLCNPLLLRHIQGKSCTSQLLLHENPDGCGVRQLGTAAGNFWALTEVSPRRQYRGHLAMQRLMLQKDTTVNMKTMKKSITMRTVMVMMMMMMTAVTITMATMLLIVYHVLVAAVSAVNADVAVVDEVLMMLFDAVVVVVDVVVAAVAVVGAGAVSVAGGVVSVAVVPKLVW